MLESLWNYAIKILSNTVRHLTSVPVQCDIMTVNQCTTKTVWQSTSAVQCTSVTVYQCDSVEVFHSRAVNLWTFWQSSLCQGRVLEGATARCVQGGGLAGQVQGRECQAGGGGGAGQAGWYCPQGQVQLQGGLAASIKQAGIKCVLLSNTHKIVFLTIIFVLCDSLLNKHISLKNKNKQDFFNLLICVAIWPVWVYWSTQGVFSTWQSIFILQNCRTPDWQSSLVYWLENLEGPIFAWLFVWLVGRLSVTVSTVLMLLWPLKMLKVSKLWWMMNDGWWMMECRNIGM